LYNNNNIIIILSFPQTYVQDLMLKEAKMIYELIAVERGHFFVCGDCKMAENVYQTLKSIIQEQTGMNSTQSDNFMLGLRVRSYEIYGDSRGPKSQQRYFYFFKRYFMKRAFKRYPQNSVKYVLFHIFNVTLSYLNIGGGGVTLFYSTYITNII